MKCSGAQNGCTHIKCKYLKTLLKCNSWVTVPLITILKVQNLCLGCIHWLSNETCLGCAFYAYQVLPVMVTWFSFPPTLTHCSSSSLWPSGCHSTTYSVGMNAVSGFLQEMETVLLLIIVCTPWGGLAKKGEKNYLTIYITKAYSKIIIS